MSRDAPTRMLRLIEAKGSTAGAVRAVHGRQFSRHRRHSVLQCTEEPDVRPPHTTLHDRRLAMSLSLLKFVGQASLVDDAMLPS